MRIRILLFTLIRISPAFHFDADPDPAFHFDADPDLAFRFYANSDLDPASQNENDQDPQHCTLSCTMYDALIVRSSVSYARPASGENILSVLGFLDVYPGSKFFPSQIGRSA
jgi:hypothetical protein